MTDPNDSKGIHPNLSLAVAAAALVVLVALPMSFEAPDTPIEIAAAIAAAAALLAIAISSVGRFLRLRRRAFADSIVPPPDPRTRREVKKPIAEDD